MPSLDCERPMKEPRSCRGQSTAGGRTSNRGSGRRVHDLFGSTCPQDRQSVRGRERRKRLVEVLVRVAPLQVDSRRPVLLAYTRSRAVPSRSAFVCPFPPASASTRAAREDAQWSRPDRPASFRRGPCDQGRDHERQEKEKPREAPREVGLVCPVVLADQERLWGGGRAGGGREGRGSRESPIR